MRVKERKSERERERERKRETELVKKGCWGAGQRRVLEENTERERG
jgi:hypothetical protein